MILLDTHALIWLAEGLADLGPEARHAADDALAEDTLAVSAISFWEIAMLADKGRLRAVQPLPAWRRELLDSGLTEIPVTGEVGLEAVALPDLHPDPVDRIIVASASLHRATLLTADRRLLDWAGPLRRIDARR